METWTRHTIEHGTVENRRFIAERTDIPADVVEALSRDVDAGVRRRIARRNSLPAAVVDTLAHDKDAFVRRYIAERADKHATK